MATIKDEEFRREHKKKNFLPEIANLTPSTRTLLETYSKIPPSEVEAHCIAVRQKAWDIHPYPCIGQWTFLRLAIGSHALYPEILQRMKTGEQKFLDLGCAFGQDVRRLVADGVDSRLCYGSDLRLDFLELGYELFRDKETLESKFIEADVFDERSALEELDGEIDIVGASLFFHLFTWEQQVKVAHRVGKLLKPCKDSVIVGVQLGDEDPGEKVTSSGKGTKWRHDAASWQRLWKEVGQSTGVEYLVDARLVKFERQQEFEGSRVVTLLPFSVRRLN